MCVQNVFAVLVRPRTEEGLTCLKRLEGSNVLVVGAVGRSTELPDDECSAVDEKLYGFDVAEEGELEQVVEDCNADVVIDCSGDALYALELLDRCLGLGVALAVAPPSHAVG